MRISRMFALAVSLALAFSLALPAAAAEETEWLLPPVKDAPAFSDTAGVWCESEVAVVYQAGLMQGQSDTQFSPSGTWMPEHVVAVCARLYSLLTGGDGVISEAEEGEAWYQPYYDYLAQALSYEGGADALMMNFHATKYPAKRWHFVKLLHETLEAAEVELPAINAVTVVPDTADPDLLDFYNAGILTGSDEYGTFRSNDTINRGQAAAILARLVDPALRQKLTLKSFDLCDDVLGLEADSQAIAITYGDAVRELSMDIVAPTLCEKLLEQYNRMLCDGVGANWLDQVLPDTIEALKKDVAIDVLAQQQGITVTEEELFEEYGGPVVSGYRGKSEAAQVWENTHNLLLSKLHQRYNETYGAEVVAPSPGAPSVGGEHLESDLQKLMDQMTAQVAPELSQLDLAAAQTRYVQSPIYSA